MTKQKYDLSNPGGQPKGPFDEPIDDSGWFNDLKMSSGCLGIALLLVVSIGSLIYGLLKIFG